MTFGESTIRTWTQAYGIKTEPDPDDEQVFMRQVALDAMVEIAHESGMYEKCAEPKVCR